MGKQKDRYGGRLRQGASLFQYTYQWRYAVLLPTARTARPVYPVPEPGSGWSLLFMSVSLFHRCTALPIVCHRNVKQKSDVEEDCAKTGRPPHRLTVLLIPHQQCCSGGNKTTRHQINGHTVPVSAGECYQRSSNEGVKPPPTTLAT